MTSTEAAALSGSTRPRLRDCPASVRELRARERALCGLHRLDRTLPGFWARLPPRAVGGRGTGGLLCGRRRPRLDRTRRLEPRSRATRLDRRGRRGRVRIAGLLRGAGPPAAEARHG